MHRAVKFLAGTALVATAAILAARMLFPLPPQQGRDDSTALPPSATGRLAQAAARQGAGHEGLTGVLPLHNGAEAFAARIMTADAAVSSIDAQYYIWHGDLTGYLLLDALRRAADRGVRVRLLLDDNGTAGLDPELAELNAHPNFEVRLYNPFNLRRLKMLSFAFDFGRLNRRMHNKSFTVDGQVSILGGRNVGDEYFDTGPTALYVDLDVLAVGRIVAEISADFDRYWTSKAVYPAGKIVGPPPAEDPVARALDRLRHNPQMAEYRSILERSDIVADLARGDTGLEWTSAMLISDDPAKGTGAVPQRDLLAARLTRAVGDVTQRFDGISAYFVPGKAGVETFAGLERSGVQVRLLTNSLEATDVLPVHAGYAKRRGDLLDAGVALFELRRQAAPGAPKDRAGPFGSSGASLHAKTFAVDGARIFIGSFNFDPRSTMLNTEMGLLIDSARLAGGVHAEFDRNLDGMAWRVERNKSGLIWVDPTEPGAPALAAEPGATLPRRIAIALLGWLPVEWLL